MRHILGRTDLLGSWLHNCISAEAYCEGEIFAGCVFEESPLQASRYRGLCHAQLVALCAAAGLAKPMITAPVASAVITRSEYEDLHFSSRFTVEFMALLRGRARFRRPIAERFAVVHIRRGDISRAHPDPCRGFSRFVETRYFRRHVDAIRASGIRRVIVLTEERGSEDVAEEFTDCDVRAARFPHDDAGRVVADWELMATCDVLVMSPSSFSFVPALFNVNTVVYKPFWHAPLPAWIDGDAHELGRAPIGVVVTTDSSNELKEGILRDLGAAGLDVTLLVDSKCNDHELRRRGRVFDHAHLCERYGRRKVEVFNGRWLNNAAKLAVFDYVAQCDRAMWAFEDDVYCRDWAAFVEAYRDDASDFVGSVYRDPGAFPEFYHNGWLCGHPDHLAHGVAGLYAFRVTPRLARAVLDALRSARHASHHELFVPWVCRQLNVRPLQDVHAQHMRHNTDPRTNSGLRVCDLDPSGLIFHPVKTASVSKVRAAIPNRPKVKLWIVVNSFNTDFYVSKCMSLVAEMLRQLAHLTPRPRVLVVFGGSRARRVDTVAALTVARLDKNLSDYGSFVGVHDALGAALISPGDRCVLLHDTVWPRAPAFADAILDLQNARESATPFLFAHPLGWYNLGVGRADFLATLGAAYARVWAIPKELAYKLEHGESVVVDGLRLSALREHSVYTMARHRVPAADVDQLTTHATGAVLMGGSSRVAVYIASLGVVKFSHGPTSYQVPVYADADLPQNEKDWHALRLKYPGLDWCLPLVESALD